MFITAHAMGQQLAVPIPTVIIHINGKRAVTLLDSGSSSSFYQSRICCESKLLFVTSETRSNGSCKRRQVNIKLCGSKL